MSLLLRDGSLRRRGEVRPRRVLFVGEVPNLRVMPRHRRLELRPKVGGNRFGGARLLDQLLLRCRRVPARRGDLGGEPRNLRVTLRHRRPEVGGNRFVSPRLAATIFIGSNTSSQGGSQLNARNGGEIYIAGDALWSTNVMIYTDDMHAIRDIVTGSRVNPFGGTVEVGYHVWLGHNVLLLPNSKIGSNSVVGARAVVKGELGMAGAHLRSQYYEQELERSELDAVTVEQVLAELQADFSRRGRSPDLTWVENLVVRSDAPEKFIEAGGVLVAPSGTQIPSIDFHPHIPPPISPIIVMGSNSLVSHITVWGEHAHIIIGNQVNLIGSVLNCGGAATIFIGSNTSSQGGSQLNARNGGEIYIAGDALWSTNVMIYTDDMHAIRDIVTGSRVNAFGGAVEVGHHVWLGQNVLLLPNSKVGASSVVGARAVVKGELPPNTVSAGIPAKVIRSGITWTHDDTP
jgi:acetyltransferase-like isoleucine patch superfamily enzyme